MINEEEKIKQEIKQWIDQNRENLPLNIDYWDIHVSKVPESQEEPKKLRFGKYEAEHITTSSFYKPHSRLVKV